MEKENEAENKAEEALWSIHHEIFVVEHSLKGLGALFQQVKSELCFEDDEIHGWGKMIELLAEKLTRQRQELDRTLVSLASLQVKRDKEEGTEKRVE